MSRCATCAVAQAERCAATNRGPLHFVLSLLQVHEQGVAFGWHVVLLHEGVYCVCHVS